MKFGAMQAVLAEPLENVFTTARELGFDGVELDWSSHERARTGNLGPNFRAGIKTAAAEAGVEVASVAAHFLNGGGIAQAEHEAEGMAVIRTGIQLCADLGAKVLLVPFFGAGEIRDGDEDRLIENLTTLAPEAEAAGVILGIETARPAAEMVRVFDTVGSEFVGSYWDMGNCWVFGYDGLEEIRTLRGHIVQVHAKEWSGPVLERVPGQYPGLNVVPFGQGDVPVAATLETLREVGYEGYVVLETGAFGDPQGAATAALNVLKSPDGR